ncbi:hypothetical protein GGX14DRAFT_400071 [Mycena pura]|uniref:Uncharacterized protein n=1 Tax=Mycena pura TaxID=153505 RepID=A0AAD6V3C7_9AGAR|nr:hypothetical protein GGX14DRAFT_400071 [Mycena pura]
MARISILPWGRRRLKEREAEWAQHIEATAEVRVRDFPNLHFVLEEKGKPPASLDDNPHFAPFRDVVKLALSHMAGVDTNTTAADNLCNIFHLIQPRAEKQFKHPIPIDTARVIHYMTHETPTIIVKDLREETPKRCLPWGLVYKGTKESDKQNAIYIHEELVRALCDTPPADLCDRKILMKLLLLITVMHEIPHALSKLIFAPDFITPVIGGLAKDDKGNGESGLWFEHKYLGFQLQACWKNDDFQKPDRMWRIESLVVVYPTGGQYLLDPKDVQHMSDSFTRSAVWTPVRESLAKYPYNKNTHVRHQCISPLDEAEHEEDPHANTIPKNIFVYNPLPYESALRERHMAAQREHQADPVKLSRRVVRKIGFLRAKFCLVCK